MWLIIIQANQTAASDSAFDMISDYNITSDVWLEWKGKQYFFGNDPLAMDDARHFCKQRHGDLVSIDSEDEDIFLWGQVSSHTCATHHNQSWVVEHICLVQYNNSNQVRGRYFKTSLFVCSYSRDSIILTFSG